MNTDLQPGLDNLRKPHGFNQPFLSCRNEGVLDDMKTRGIKYIQLYCVDNILVKVGHRKPENK